MPWRPAWDRCCRRWRRCWPNAAAPWPNWARPSRRRTGCSGSAGRATHGQRARWTADHWDSPDPCHPGGVDSARAFAQLFRRCPLPMWIYDTATVRFLAVNAATSRLYGWSEAELLTMTVYDLLPPEEAERLGKILARTMLPRTGPAHWRHRLRDGTLIDTEIISEPLTLDGRHVRVVLARDVTQQLRADAALRGSEQRYRTIVETAHEGIWLIDAESITTFVNPAMARMLGHTPEQMLGRPLHDFMDEEAREAADRNLERRRQGLAEQHDFRLRHRLGHDVWTLMMANPLFDEAGAYAGALAMVTDITERRRAELREHHRGAVMALVAGGAPLPAVLAAVVEMIEREQPGSLCSILLLDHSGTRLRMGAAPHLPAAYNAALDGLLIGPDVGSCGTAAFGCQRVVVESIATDPLWHDYRALAAAHGLAACWSEPILSRAGAVLGTFGVYRRQPHRPDEAETSVVAAAAQMAAIAIERQQADEALRESQKMESLGTLAGGIAHDFNNILGAILGNLNLLQQEQALDGPAQARLGQIHRSALRARALVHQILAFSRRQPHVLMNQPLRPLVEEALALLRASLPAGVRLDTVFADEPLPVCTDATQMQQVLMNLCSNAWHALPGDLGRIEVGLAPALLDEGQARRLGGLRVGPHAHLWVKDTGTGMDEVTRARIFEPFFTTKPVGEGTGLGLAVVHGIVTEHQGAISVDSAPGRGSTFHLYLPLSEGAQAAAAVPAPGVAPVAVATGQHILCVDDDEVMLLTDEGLLAHLGYQVSTQADGQSALEALRAAPGRFDLVVSDYNMPGLSGLDLARELAALRPELPVIICSGYITDELQHEARALGVRGLVHKENTVEELGPMVQRVLGGAH
ncbi:MAG: PAS domain S-box protein [Burkholderiales bacterium]|nr:PAS domain S-box protein [Burkholderiales bacterium]